MRAKDATVPSSDARRHQAQAVAQHQAQHANARRPQRESHPDLLTPQSYAVRHHAVDPDQRERHCHAGEGAEQHEIEPPMPERAVHEFA